MCESVIYKMNVAIHVAIVEISCDSNVRGLESGSKSMTNQQDLFASQRRHQSSLISLRRILYGY